MYDFDRMPARAGSDSIKWHAVSGDILPMWVADLDMETPREIIDAVCTRAAHPYYGYPYTQDALKPLIVAHYRKIYGVELDPDWIVWVPSVIPGVVTALEMMNGSFMYSVPMYDHIRRLDDEAGLPVIEVPLKRDENCRYTMDVEALEAALTPEVKCLILCNPHNPIGRVYTRGELEEIQAFASRHNLLVICDEIHCELDLEGRHIPYFSLNEAAARYSVTVSSAGKICNIPGLPMGFAVIPNAELRHRFFKQQDGLQTSGNILTLAAYEKAYDGSCAVWKEELREYLRGNRDLAEARFKQFPELRLPHNEGTYLLWIDCSALGLDDPAEFFLEKAHVKVCSGEIFGYQQCIRFNYGCPRGQLIEVLDRMEKALLELRKN